LAVYPRIYMVLYIPAGAGFLPSTASTQNKPCGHATLGWFLPVPPYQEHKMPGFVAGDDNLVKGFQTETAIK